MIFKLSIAEEPKHVEMSLKFVRNASQTLFVNVWIFGIIKLVDKLCLKWLEIV